MSSAGVPTALRDALADRYAIDREIGAGGMATVYLAEDLKHRRRVTSERPLFIDEFISNVTARNKDPELVLILNWIRLLDAPAERR